MDVERSTPENNNLSYQEMANCSLCSLSFLCYNSLQVGVLKLKTATVKGKIDPSHEQLWLNNKRMLVEEEVSRLRGVQFMITSITGKNSTKI